ncbi:nuclease-related domain-containing protein [Lentibacillus salinarum]|uniref:Nuclease-related domain-containing protein n=1 Tax=Lentibacillus salinarum TaxID=446820 RepID=A0ABW3ZRW7_9BACI
MTPTNIKQRKKSHELLACEALFRRVLKEYRQKESIVSAYKREKAGYDGEKNVDYKLSTYPHKDLFVFQGIRLPNFPFYFQIDTLILTRRFIGILEVKNKKGTFNYDSKQQQLTQEVNGEVKSFKDPILQAKAQKTHLRGWLEKHGIFNVPIETLVVIAYPTTTIVNIREDPEVYNTIIHNESLHEHLNRLNRKYTKNILTNNSLKKLCRSLLDEDAPLRTDILTQLGINKQHLIAGIPCERCYAYPMNRLYKKWQCPSCLATDLKAHERIILDYFLLHQTSITNKECREVLQIDSPRTAHSILKSMHLQHDRENRARKYLAPSINDFPQRSTFPYINSSKQIEQFY